MRRILLIEGHPDADPARFNLALADSYAEGAAEAGHDVMRFRVADMDIPILRSAQEWGSPPPTEDLREAQRALARADHLVVLHPLWMGGMPALTRAFFEQVSAGGGVIEMDAESGKWEKKLSGKSARLIVTMGMPALVYRLYFRAHSVRSFERNVLRFSGVDPVRESLIGLVESSDAHRKRWLRRLRALGRKAI